MASTSLDPGLSRAAAAGVRRDRAAPRAVAVWLLACAGMVFAMAVIGAITRLTESGLSITEWRPVTGALPPLSQAAWEHAFALYRETPEYRLRNLGMSLDEFRQIYFWEWLHRLWGRLIGLVFAVPLVVFWLRGAIPRGLGPRLVAALALGGLQGVVGWYMVKSGLVDRPSVSHYRLALHLGLAFLIYAWLVWLALGLLFPGRGASARPGLRAHGWAAVALAAVTMLWGALVAGLDAGFAYNTFPLMDGRLLPPEALSLRPAWLNLTENAAFVQFTHRWLAIVTALVVLTLWLRARSLGGRAGAAAGACALMVLVQVALGVSTLLLAVPIGLAAAHQAGALVLLSLLLWLAFEMAGEMTGEMAGDRPAATRRAAGRPT